MTRVLGALNAGLHESLELDQTVHLLGEDIVDPYGGAFKVTQGLSTRFPDRVHTTPISEAAITGLAAGMALRGLKPVVEIMFGDFMALCYDQLLNHVSKFKWMYNRQVRVPLVVRTPMGGRRGYGPTHSQSIEKYLLGIPGIRIVAANTFISPRQMLVDAITKDVDPTIFIEHKLLYGKPVRDPRALSGLSVEQTGGMYPTVELTWKGAPRPMITIACYGFNAELVAEAMEILAFEKEIFSEAVVLAQLSPLEIEPVLRSVMKTSRLLTVEEGGLSFGWGSELISRVCETLPSSALNPHSPYRAPKMLA